MAQLKATGLAHIKEGHLDEAVFSQHCIDWSWSALRIKACIDISVPRVSVEVYLVGVLIGQCTLDPQHSECKLGGSVDGFKAEVGLKIVNNCSLVITAEVCAPIVGCKKVEHTLFSWC